MDPRSFRCSPWVKQPLSSDWQLTCAFAGCMKNGIGNCRRRANERKLTKSLHPERVHAFVMLLNEVDSEFRYIHIHWDEVIGHMGIDRAAISWVKNSPLHQRHSDATHHPSNALAFCEKRIDYVAGRIGSHHSSYLDVSEVGIDSDLRENSGKGIH